MKAIEKTDELNPVLEKWPQEWCCKSLVLCVSPSLTGGHSAEGTLNSQYYLLWKTGRHRVKAFLSEKRPGMNLQRAPLVKSQSVLARMLIWRQTARNLLWHSEHSSIFIPVCVWVYAHARTCTCAWGRAHTHTHTCRVSFYFSQSIKFISQWKHESDLISVIYHE